MIAKGPANVAVTWSRPNSSSPLGIVVTPITQTPALTPIPATFANGNYFLTIPDTQPLMTPSYDYTIVVTNQAPVGQNIFSAITFTGLPANCTCTPVLNSAPGQATLPFVNRDDVAPGVYEVQGLATFGAGAVPFTFVITEGPSWPQPQALTAAGGQTLTTDAYAYSIVQGATIDIGIYATGFTAYTGLWPLQLYTTTGQLVEPGAPQFLNAWMTVPTSLKPATFTPNGTNPVQITTATIVTTLTTPPGIYTFLIAGSSPPGVPSAGITIQVVPAGNQAAQTTGTLLSGALVKRTPGAVKGSSGVIATNWKGTQVFRPNVHPVNPNSPGQSMARQKHQIIVAGILSQGEDIAQAWALACATFPGNVPLPYPVVDGLEGMSLGFVQMTPAQFQYMCTQTQMSFGSPQKIPTIVNTKFVASGGITPITSGTWTLTATEGVGRDNIWNPYVYPPIVPGGQLGIELSLQNSTNPYPTPDADTQNGNQFWAFLPNVIVVNQGGSAAAGTETYNPVEFSAIEYNTDWTISGLGAGVNAIFYWRSVDVAPYYWSTPIPATLTPYDMVAFSVNFTASEDATPGTYAVTLTAVCNGVTNYCYITLIVYSAADSPYAIAVTGVPDGCTVTLSQSCFTPSNSDLSSGIQGAVLASLALGSTAVGTYAITCTIPMNGSPMSIICPVTVESCNETVYPPTIYFPAYKSMSTTCIYDASYTLAGIYVYATLDAEKGTPYGYYIDPSLAPTAIVLYATSASASSVTARAGSGFKVINYYDYSPAYDQLPADWEAVYGKIPAKGTIYWMMCAVDPIGGIVGPSIIASSEWENGTLLGFQRPQEGVPYYSGSPAWYGPLFVVPGINVTSWLSRMSYPLVASAAPGGACQYQIFVQGVAAPGGGDWAAGAPYAGIINLKTKWASATVGEQTQEITQFGAPSIPWTMTFNPPSLNIPSGNTTPQMAILTVSVPAGAPEGTWLLEIEAYDGKSSVTEKAYVGIANDVVNAIGYAMTPSVSTLPLVSGTDQTIEFTIANPTATPQAFTVKPPANQEYTSAVGLDGWINFTTSVGSGAVTVPAGTIETPGTANFTLTVSPSGNVPTGTNFNLFLEAYVPQTGTFPAGDGYYVYLQSLIDIAT